MGAQELGAGVARRNACCAGVKVNARVPVLGQAMMLAGLLAGLPAPRFCG